VPEVSWSFRNDGAWRRRRQDTFFSQIRGLVQSRLAKWPIEDAILLCLSYFAALLVGVPGIGCSHAPKSGLRSPGDGGAAAAKTLTYRDLPSPEEGGACGGQTLRYRTRPAPETAVNWGQTPRTAGSRGTDGSPGVDGPTGADVPQVGVFCTAGAGAG